MAPPPSATDASAAAGERLAAAIAAQDPEALRAVLAPAIQFRALTPGRFWEAADPDTVDGVILGTWFPAERKITEILSVVCGTVGTVDHVAYRFRATRPDGEFLIEQQAYLSATDGRIDRLQILCSGFIPAP